MAQYQFIIILLILIATFGITFYKSYFSESAKSAVTKRDIEEITKKVESVKLDFTKEIEHLKVELSFNNTIKQTLYNDKKEAVIKLYEAVHLYFETIDQHLIGSVEYGEEKLEEAEDEIEKYELALTLAEHKAELYIEDESFFKAFDVYAREIDKLERLTMKLLVDIDTNDSEATVLYNSAFNASKPIRRNIDQLCGDFRAACISHISKP